MNKNEGRRAKSSLMIRAEFVESSSWPGGVRPDGLVYVDDLPTDAKIWLREGEPGHEELMHVLAEHAMKDIAPEKDP
jgi:hypothetical protein